MDRHLTFDDAASMNEVTIRKAVADDLHAIGELWKEFMDFHKAGDSHFTRSADGHERFKEFITQHISSESACVWVAEKDGKVVGYCLAMLAKRPPVFGSLDYGAVFDLAVSGAYRRSGIGERLYLAAQTWFADHGIHRIEVAVALSNEVSRAFWKKMGFSPYLTKACKTI